MKLKQKLSSRIALALAVLAGFVFSHSAMAAGVTATWVDRSTIQITSGDKTAYLIDSSWDHTWQYTGSVDGCDTSKLDGFGDTAVIGFGNYNSSGDQTASWSTGLSKANLVFNSKPSGGFCTQTTASGLSITGPNAAMAFRYTDSAHTGIARVDGDSSWTFANPATVPSGFHSGMKRYYRASDGPACQDVIDVSATDMYLYEQISGSGSPLDTATSHCKLKSTIHHIDNGGVPILATDTINKAVPSDFKMPIGEPFDATTGGTTGGTGGATGADDACYSGGWALSFIACPVITVAQSLANSMYTFVEQQLSFRVPDDLGGQDGAVHNAWNEFRILVSGLVVILLLVMVISQAIGSGPFDAYTVRKLLPRLVAGVILIQISWPVFTAFVNFVDDLGRGLADIMYAPFGGASALDLNTLMSKLDATAVAFNWIGVVGGIVAVVVVPFLLMGVLLTVLAALFAGFLTLLFREILIILALIVVPVALIAWMMPNEGLRIYWKKWWENFSKALLMFPMIIAIIAAGRIFALIGSGDVNHFLAFFIIIIGFFGPLFILPKTFKWGGTIMSSAGQNIADARTKALKKPQEFLNTRQQGYSAERTRQSQERYAADKGVELNKNWRRAYGIPSLWRRPIDLIKSGEKDPTLWGRRERMAKQAYRQAGEKSHQEEQEAANLSMEQDWRSLRESGTWVDPKTGATHEIGTKDDYVQSKLWGKPTLGKNGLEKRFVTDDGRVLDPTQNRSETELLAAAHWAAVLLGGTNARHLTKLKELVNDSLRPDGQKKYPDEQSPLSYSAYRRFENDHRDIFLEKLTAFQKGTASASDASPEAKAKIHGIGEENIVIDIARRLEKADQTIASLWSTRDNPESREKIRSSIKEIKFWKTRLDGDASKYLGMVKNGNINGTAEAGGLRFWAAQTTGDTQLSSNLIRSIDDDAEDGRAVLKLATAGGARPVIQKYLDPAIAMEMSEYLAANANKDDVSIRSTEEVAAMRAAVAGGTP